MAKTYLQEKITASGLLKGNGSGTISSATASDIPDLPSSKITSGTFGDARIPNLSASKITNGTFSADRIPSLDASKISSGIFASAFLPIATSSAKGAVMPVAKTDAMTQDVGIDANGKLYTAAGGGGGGDPYVIIAAETTTNYYKTISLQNGKNNYAIFRYVDEEAMNFTIRINGVDNSTFSTCTKLTIFLEATGVVNEQGIVNIMFNGISANVIRNRIDSGGKTYRDCNVANGSYTTNMSIFGGSALAYQGIEATFSGSNGLNYILVNCY